MEAALDIHATGILIVKRKNVRLAFLLVLCLLNACTHMVTNKGQPKVAKHPLVPSEWPVSEDDSLATVVVINPYEKRCCGATASYEVTIRDMFGAEVYRNGELLPIDDFFCVSIKPGFYEVALSSGMASHHYKLEARKGSYSFIAADVQLTEPAEVLLYSMNKTDAMQYVNRTAHRLAPLGENFGRAARLKDKLNCRRNGTQ